MVQHRSMYKSWIDGVENIRNYSVFRIFEKFGVDNCRIVLVELCPCESKDELLKRESHYIRTVECVNKIIPDRTRKESRAINYALNSEHIKKSDQTYKQEHRQERYDRDTVVINCECGSQHGHGGKARHLKTQKHINYIANQPIVV
jgi:hypothetical protein